MFIDKILSKALFIQTERKTKHKRNGDRFVAHVKRNNFNINMRNVNAIAAVVIVVNN